MRKKNLLIGAAMLAAVSLTGICSAEELTESAAVEMMTETFSGAEEEAVSEAARGEYHHGNRYLRCI